MFYNNNNDLPDDIKKDLPIHARDIFRKAFNEAWQKYEAADEVSNIEESKMNFANKQAWDAVNDRFYKNEYEEWVHREKKELSGRYKRAA